EFGAGRATGGDACYVSAHRELVVRELGDRESDGTHRDGAVMAAVLVTDHHADADGAVARAVAEHRRLARGVRVRLRPRRVARGAHLSRRDAHVWKEAHARRSREMGALRIGS